MENVDKVIEIIKDLISMLQDSTAKYQSASANVDDMSIKELLLIYSRERSFYLLQLQHEMDKLTKQSSSDSDENREKKTERNFENTFSIHSFLSTCLETEEKLIYKYKFALQKINFHSMLSLLLQNQLSGIEKSLIQIKSQQSLK